MVVKDENLAEKSAQSAPQEAATGVEKRTSHRRFVGTNRLVGRKALVTGGNGNP